MKTIIKIIGLFTILFTGNVAYCQNGEADIDVVQALLGRNKRLIIAEYMQLEEKEKNSFWHLYDQYEEKRKDIEKEVFLLLNEYAEKYKTLNDAEAHKLIVNFMKSMDENNALRKVYFKKMEKEIGSLKAAKFIQLETFIQTSSQANLQNQVPMIGELERLNRQNTELQLRKTEKNTRMIETFN
ncbi:hypothetical protein [Flavobacterium sp. MDT1-60]|uniref:hypothetical protein n=1 Tax=Flavobacterium sp. MDT1-60 TaxID=1979344 RepID=UPI00177C780F|nr:hypothetical protein [Flavobacterium sp. MDT1-60]QOG01208.1 hypothetical protein IHE43_15480 [Flavobacterium sp. MDT1-60]